MAAKRIDEGLSFDEYLKNSLNETRAAIGQPAPGGEGYVGFDQMPTQVHTRAMKAGFSFNIMVVGETGLGKTTLLNTLFLRKLLPPRPKKDMKGPPQTLKVEATHLEVVENGVKLNLCLVDTPGFGGKINNEESWAPIIQYINEQYQSFLKEEGNPNRKIPIADTRVHCCLYFIEPTGPNHGLKQLDVELMKRIHERVNIIPVVAKADTMSEKDLEKFKQVIRDEIKFHEISVVEFPDDAECKIQWPFAVVGSVDSADVGRSLVLAREYPWGVCEVENDKHNDFVCMRDLVIRKFMIFLMEHTAKDLYEQYRRKALEDAGFDEALPEPGETAKPKKDGGDLKTKQAKFEKEKSSSEAKLKKWGDELKQREDKLRKMVEQHKKKLEEEKKRKA